MTSPVFFSALFRRFVVETREAGGAWREYGRFRRLEEAKRARRAAVKGSGREARIVNRVTGEVVGNN